MKAAVLPHALANVTIREINLPEPGPREALVRMQACGICHSDLFVAGLEKLPREPVILGHEGIARIEAVGAEVRDWKPGDRAGMTFLATTCGDCEWCGSGRERLCPKQTNFGYSLDGALAEYAMVPAAALVRVPEQLAAADAAPLCCAGWTAYGALREAGVSPGDTVALFGFGGLGHLALQIARHQGLRPIAVDLSEEKLAMAREAGAEFTAQADQAGRTLQKQAGGVNAALVLTPSPAAIQQAFRSLKRNGTLVLVGMKMASYELPLVDTILKGIQVRGSYLGTRADLAAVFVLASAGLLKPHVTTHSLEETPELLERLGRGEILGRAVIVF